MRERRGVRAARGPVLGAGQAHPGVGDRRWAQRLRPGARADRDLGRGRRRGGTSRSRRASRIGITKAAELPWRFSPPAAGSCRGRRCRGCRASVSRRPRVSRRARLAAGLGSRRRVQRRPSRRHRHRCCRRPGSRRRRWCPRSVRRCRACPSSGRLRRRPCRPRACPSRYRPRSHRRSPVAATVPGAPPPVFPVAPPVGAAGVVRSG